MVGISFAAAPSPPAAPRDRSTDQTPRPLVESSGLIRDLASTLRSPISVEPAGSKGLVRCGNWLGLLAGRPRPDAPWFDGPGAIGHIASHSSVVTFYRSR